MKSARARLKEQPDFMVWVATLQDGQEWRDRADRYDLQVVQTMRRKGCSWEMIGELFGITRQAAHDRFASRV